MFRYLGLPLAAAIAVAGCGDTGTSAPGTSEPDAPADAATSVEQQPAANPVDVEQLGRLLASSAKRLCSSVYVSGRTQAHVLAEELDDAVAQGLAFRLGDDPRAAIASAAGESALAVFRPHLGCTLVDPGRVDELLDQLDPAEHPAIVALAPDEAWPAGAMVDLPDSLDSLDLAAVNAAIEAAFAEPDPDARVLTRGVVVVHDGRIVAERYADPFAETTPQLGWSMTKTATNALTGILVRDGVLQVEAPAPVDDWRSEGDARGGITLEHLLHMSSGLEFAEVYSVGEPSDVVDMLYGGGANDMGGFAANKPLAHPPGTHWHYSSGTSNLISRVHRESFDELQDYLAFPRERLFNELGMASAVLEPDVSGTFVGSSYLYATPRDWARLGLLYLQDGVWNGTRILPEGWVDFSLAPAPAAGNGQYGAHVWLNQGSGDQPEARPHPELPAEMFYLSGFEGQNVVVVPSAELVVVRMGLTRSGPSPVWALTRRILEAAN